MLEKEIMTQQSKYTKLRSNITNCAPFTEYINEIHNTEIGDGSYLYTVMLTYNKIEQIDSKATGILISK